ncbi:hypothetical protein AC578_7961, partial [Pseudocercospora eumusae]
MLYSLRSRPQNLSTRNIYPRTGPKSQTPLGPLPALLPPTLANSAQANTQISEL